MGILTPTLFAETVFDIDFSMLIKKGIKVLIFDIDNTLAATSVKKPSKEIVEWLAAVKAKGFKVCFVSNNSKRRVHDFSDGLDVFYLHRALKPFTVSFLRVAKKYNAKNEEVCVIGDQIFTDIWGANWAKMMSVLIAPLSDDEGFGIKLKRFLEKVILKQKFMVIGNPVRHSVSPILHSEIYRFYNINAKYGKERVEKEDIRRLIEKYKKVGIRGFNITVPHKQNIMPYLDEISEDAKKIGAVNTVKIVNDKLFGYNTDGAGFVAQLSCKVENARIKIIGAGGSAMSLVNALAAKNPQEIIIYNRTIANAQGIAQKYDKVFARNISEFSPQDCDILINTTSVGLSPNVSESPISNLEGISKDTVVYDLIYKPPITKFMQMAMDKGCQAHNGYKMLIYQGIIAAEIWFGKSLINDELVDIIIERLENEV